MEQMVVPMIHVPNVREAVDWYVQIGFKVLNTYGDESDGLSFAILSFGSTRVMFNEGGGPSSSHRREVDLYVYTDDVDGLYGKLKDRVEIVEPPHDTFYGMRELICRDLNRFWITFGQQSVYENLLTAVQRNDVERVKQLIAAGNIKPLTLTAALVLATDNANDEVVSVLKHAGAQSPAEVDEALLRSYVGSYSDGDGFEVKVTFDNGRLYGAPGQQEPLRLFAINETTFTPVEFENYGLLVFDVTNKTVNGCAIKHGTFEKKLGRT